MDYIKTFDIELEKEQYYAGETLVGWVVIENTENIKARGVRCFLRGKAHVEWKITRGGERRTVKEDQYFVDEKKVVWGKDKHEEGSFPIMPRGHHHFRFEFKLPECALPCSFESKMGTIRYYLRVIFDIPYASTPQGLKYFTVIGPHVDCMEDRYLVPVSCAAQSEQCCLCCVVGPVNIEATLERSAYCCGEKVKLKYEIQNGGEENAWVICRLIQNVEYHINKGVLGLTKETQHEVWEARGQAVRPHTTESFHDFYKNLQVPVMPATLVDVCKVIDIYYILRVSLGLEKSGERLGMEFPIDIGTMPFRIPNSPAPTIRYEMAVDYVEGGLYISPEFQLGQVYDGTAEHSREDIILYRPVYVCVPDTSCAIINTGSHATDGSVMGNDELTEEKCTSV
ncbi:hypothetical protein NP493_177g00000 [Ridgeia piscesae]|uniref:Arrestin C-terminal-like domain-containing protein n=1 Tax=Ridgeia piscesae TaxID=27915 RepID=A0AAD9P2S8_RIDPI|nr:hypothetical protein NP493_177g00000 [Ridgeia piscesae]